MAVSIHAHKLVKKGHIREKILVTYIISVMMIVF